MNDPVKLIIVMRTDLNMRKGKMIAQGAHAASAFLIERLNRVEGPTRLCTNHPWTPVESEWLSTGMTKICVRVESEEGLLDIHKRAEEAGLKVHLITDLGRTEFKEPTRTCLAIGPARSSEVDAITGNLSLL